MEDDGPQMPEKFGKYIVKEQLGQGGMGVVWKAEDPFLGGYVAIKELHPGISARRLQAEAQLIRSLNKAKDKIVVLVYDFEPQSERRNAYYVMEYMSNGGLVKDDAPIKTTPKKCVEILRPIAAAIDHAHQKGILHRDIKPGNILFDDENRPRLSDFSIAYWEPSSVEPAPPAGMTDSPRTLARPLGSKGEFVGTPEYAAPELFNEDGKHSKTSDTYSLAVVAFEMLTGKRPVVVDAPINNPRDDAAVWAAWRNAHAKALPIDITKYGTKNEFSLHYQTVFRKALNKDPTQRYKTAKRFIEQLEEARIKGPVADLTLRELPRLLLGRSDEGSSAASAAAYRHIRRQGFVALGIWLAVLIGVILLLSMGHLGALPPHLLSKTLWELLTEDTMRVFSPRLLASPGFLGLFAGLLLAFPLCRLLAGTAARAGSDRYWQEGKIKKLKQDLKELLGDTDSPKSGAARSGKKTPHAKNAPAPVSAPAPEPSYIIWDQSDHPSPVLTGTKQGIRQSQGPFRARHQESRPNKKPMWLDDLYHYLGFKTKKWDLHKNNIDNECKYLYSKCESGVKLFRLRAFIDSKTKQPPSAIDPAGRSCRLLKIIEIALIILLAVLMLGIVPAIFYWIDNPVTAFTPWAVGGIIFLWLGYLAAMWLVLSREVKTKH